MIKSNFLQLSYLDSDKFINKIDIFVVCHAKNTRYLIKHTPQMNTRSYISGLCPSVISFFMLSYRTHEYESQNSWIKFLVFTIKSKKFSLPSFQFLHIPMLLRYHVTVVELGSSSSNISSLFFFFSIFVIPFTDKN